METNIPYIELKKLRISQLDRMRTNLELAEAERRKLKRAYDAKVKQTPHYLNRAERGKITSLTYSIKRRKAAIDRLFLEISPARSVKRANLY